MPGGAAIVRGDEREPPRTMGKMGEMGEGAGTEVAGRERSEGSMMECYYRNELVTVYKGDCLEIMPQLDMTFDCCITDPPYGTTACRWDSVIPFEPMWEQLKRLVKSRGAICLFGSEPFSSKLRLSNLPMFKYDWVWEKSYSVGFVNAKLKPMNRHEMICVFSYGKTSNGNKNNMVYHPQGLKKYGKILITGNKPRKQNTYWRQSWKSSNIRMPSHFTVRDGEKAIHTEKPYIQDYTNYPDTVLHFDRKGKTIHPTQKPVALIEYLIRTYTNDGELVLDFTAGSGTTGVACMRTGRRGVLIEREEKYCEIIANRLEHWQDESAGQKQKKRKKIPEMKEQMVFGF